MQHAKTRLSIWALGLYNGLALGYACAALISKWAWLIVMGVLLIPTIYLIATAKGWTEKDA
jgi:hypothetical protein